IMKKVLSVILMVAIGLSICSAIYASDSEWEDYEEPEKKVETIIKNQDIVFPTDDIKTIDKVVTQEEADVLANEGIMPRGIICKCGGNMRMTKQTYSSWIVTGTTKCPHDRIDHIRYVYERNIIVDWQCSDCPLGYSDITKQRREECK
ncbi:MAG: hypothetical protein RSE93_08095, partial [Oscillospiraceae bacterium]